MEFLFLKFLKAEEQGGKILGSEGHFGLKEDIFSPIARNLNYIELASWEFQTGFLRK
jgi:hypothetical protein